MDTIKFERILLITILIILTLGLLAITLWGVPEEIIL